MTALLTLEAVSMTFLSRRGLLGSARVQALDSVSLDVALGQTVAVVGESGSGKTTLGRIALRLLRPTAGRVTFGGIDITSLPERRLRSFRREAQGIFQDPFSSLDPYMSVAQAVEEPLVIQGVGDGAERQERARQALEEVGLTPVPEMAAKFPHQLSGGQRQRVAAARALVLGPRLIVADEPVSLLDASSRAEVVRLFRDVQARRGVSIIYITHDLSTARYFAHELVILYRGRVVESGPTARVLASPGHAYTRALLEAVPEPDPANRLRERKVSY